MLRRLITACSLAFALSAVPATAVVITFDLNGTGTEAGAGNYANSRSYSVTASGYTVKMRASAWSWNSTTGKLTDAYLGTFDQGLGVINRSEGQGANNTHTVDNQSGYDFILFQFDKEVQLASVVANAFAIGGTLDNDLTVGRSINTTGSAWNSVPGWNNTTVTNNMTGLFQAQKNIYSSTTGGSLDATRVLNPAGSSLVTGKLWMISASLKNTDNKVDAFKLDTLKVNANTTNTNIPGFLGPIPEPASWAMLISGFGLIGATLRRRRAAIGSARFI